MKPTLFYFLFSFICFDALSQDSTFAKLNPNKKVLMVEAACGQCQFKMKGEGCTLAVKMNGKFYFVVVNLIQTYKKDFTLLRGGMAIGFWCESVCIVN